MSDDIEHILSGLGSHRCDNRDTWIRVGMAIHAAGFPCDVWDRWSATSSKYKAGDCEKNWKGFKPNGNGKAVGVGTLVAWAREDTPGFKPKPSGGPRAAFKKPEPKPPAPVVREWGQGFEAPALALAEKAEEIISGRLKDVQFGPWPKLTAITQALLPATTTLICGGQGVGKSLFVIEACIYWLSKGISFKYLGLEENREFYLFRALAQIEGNSMLTRYDYTRDHPEVWRAALDKNIDQVNELGKCIVEAENPLTGDQILDWIRGEIKTTRILIVDPITAKVDQGMNIAKDDERFVAILRTMVKGSRCSVILITHPVKMSASSKKEASKGWGDDVSGGVAFMRFAQTVLSITGGSDYETVKVLEKTEMGNISSNEPINRRIRCSKVRNAWGQWMEVGYHFDPKTLRHQEKGVISK